MSTQLHIQALDLKARGVVQHAGLQYICDGALPGETVVIDEIEQRRGRALAQQFSILCPVPARTAPVCAHYGECGGCQFQHAAYAAQLHYKQVLLAEALQRHGAVQPAAWLAPLAGASIQ